MTATAESSAAAAAEHSRRTLIITVSTVCSTVSVLICVAIGFACWRCCHRDRFPRGITPIDDDEIETWKAGWVPEKAAAESGVTGVAKDKTDGAGGKECMTANTTPQSFQRSRGINVDTFPCARQSMRPPNRVIIDEEPLPSSPLASLGIRGSGSTAYPYFNAPTATTVTPWHGQHQSEDVVSPRSVRSARSLSLGQSARAPVVGRFSLDQSRGTDAFAMSPLSSHGAPLYELPLPADVRARAPNSRVGLTDETIPGDPSFLPSPKPVRRQPSKLVKQQPPSSGHHKSSSSASSNGGSHSFRHMGNTRSGRSNSSVSGRSLIVEGQQQHHHDEHVPPLPTALTRERSFDNAPRSSNSAIGNRSRAYSYLHHNHAHLDSSSSAEQEVV